MSNASPLNPTIPSTSERIQLDIGDVWYHLRNMATGEYEVVLIREIEDEDQYRHRFVNYLSLTHGDNFSMRTIDACVHTGRIWPLKVG